MQSKLVAIGTAELPLVEQELSMVPFNLLTLVGLPEQFKDLVTTMLQGIHRTDVIGWFTIHGCNLKAQETHRRGGRHIDGNYSKAECDWGGGGWKVGENGPAVNSAEHQKFYMGELGGIVMVSNHSACRGWIGEFDGTPGVGGDCTHITPPNDGFMLSAGTVYYGNNHFIHESLPMDTDVHRVMARITMPLNHVYQIQ